MFEFEMLSDDDEDGMIPYQGDMSATDFHLKFNIPFASAFADEDDDEPGLLFSHDNGGVTEWNFMVSADNTEIWFIAPGVVALDFNESFLIEAAV